MPGAHDFGPRTLESRELGRQVQHGVYVALERQAFRLRLLEESREVRAEVVEAVRDRRHGDDVGFGKGVEDRVADESAQGGEVGAHAFEQPEHVAAGIDGETFVRRYSATFGHHVLGAEPVSLCGRLQLLVEAAALNDDGLHPMLQNAEGLFRHCSLIAGSRPG